MSRHKEIKEKTIAFELGDYILINVEDKKYLCSVSAKSDGICKAIYDKPLPYDEVDFNFERADVIANFGQKPWKAGHEVFYKEMNLDFGKVAFFTKISSATRDEVKAALIKGYNELKKRFLVSFFPVNIEIRPEKGKALGHYTVDKKTDIDTMCLRIHDQQNFLESFFHEAGHGIWHRLVTSRTIKTKWIETYQEFVQVQHLGTKQLRSMYKDLNSLRSPIAEYKATLEDEEQISIFKEILSYIKKYHRLSVSDLDSIIEGGNFGLLEKIWPNDYLSITKLKDSGITDYSLKSVEEFFCEAVAFYLSGRDMPKALRKLTEKTLSSCATK